MDSAGSAAEENAKVLDSIEGHLASLNSEWEKLSKNLINSGLVKMIVDFGTALLSFSNTGVGQFILKTALLTTGVVALTKAFALLKVGLLAVKLRVVDFAKYYILLYAQSKNQTIANYAQAASYLGVANSIKAVTLAMLKNPIFLAGAAIMSVVSLTTAIDKYNQSLLDSAKASEEAADEFKKIGDNQIQLNDLVDKVKEYKEILKDTTSTTSEIEEATQGLYGIQETLDDLYKDNSLDVYNDDLDTTIAKTKELIKDEINYYKIKHQAQLSEAKEKTSEDVNKQSYNISKGDRDPRKRGYRDVLGDIFSEGDYGSTTFGHGETFTRISGNAKDAMNFLQSAYNYINENSESIMKKYSLTADEVEDLKNQLGTTFTEIESEYKGHFDFITEYLNTMLPYADGFADFSARMKEAGLDGKLTDEETKNILKDFPEVEKVLKDAGGGALYLKDTYQALTDEEGNVVASNTEVVTSTDAADSALTTLATSMDKLQDKYDTLTGAVDEFNKNGYLTADTLKALVDNDLLQYLEWTEQGLIANTDALFNEADAAKLVAISKLQESYSKDVLALSEGNLANASQGAQNALNGEKGELEGLGTLASAQAGGLFTLATAQAAVEASSGKLDLNKYKSDLDTLNNYYNSLAKTIGNVNIGGTRGKFTGSKSSSSSKEWWETALSDLKDQFNYNEITIEAYINSLQNLLGKVSKGTEAWKKINEELQKQRLTKLKDDYSAGRISLEQYIAGLKNLIKAYKEGTDAWNDLAEAIKKAKLDALKEEQDNLKKALSAVNKALDKQKESLEDARDAELEKIEADIKAKEAQKELAENSVEDYEKAQQAVVDYLNEQLDVLNKVREETESYYDTAIESLTAMNEEQAETVELAEAYETLMNSMTEKTKKVWREGLGWVWTTDQKAIEDAKKTYEDLLHNATIKDIEEQKESTISSLEDQITALEDYISTWDEVLDKFDNEQNRNLADTLLGDNWSELVSTLDPEIVNNFGEAYYNLQKELAGYEAELEELNDKKDAADEYWDAQIEKLQEYIDAWKDVSSSYEDEQERQIAVAKLGADWEAQILDQRIDTLNKFKDRYNAILGEIDFLDAMSTDNAVTYTSPNVSSFSKGGEVNYTGLAMLHGTPSKPEYVLNNDQMKNLLGSLTKPQVVSTMSGKGGATVNNYNFGNIELPNVNNAQQFINELKSLVNITKNQ